MWRRLSPYLYSESPLIGDRCRRCASAAYLWRMRGLISLSGKGVRANVARLRAALRAREVVEVDDLALLARSWRRPCSVGGLVDLEPVLGVRVRRPRVSYDADLPQLVRLVRTSEGNDVDTPM